MIGPASTMPRPPPMPMIAEMSAMPCGTRSSGNSSRMIANASGKTAPPAPWITRAMTITPIVVASAGEQRAEREHDEHRDHRALLAEHVAEPSGDRRHDRRAEQVRREDPRGARRRRVEVVLDREQRRRDERLQQRVRNGRDREQRERDVVVLAVNCVGHADAFRCFRPTRRTCASVSGGAAIGVAFSARRPSKMNASCRRQSSGATSPASSSTRSLAQKTSAMSCGVKSLRSEPSACARATSLATSGRSLRRIACARASPCSFVSTTSFRPRLRPCRTSASSTKRVKPRHASGSASDCLGEGDELLERLLENGVDEVCARREVAVERPDADARVPRDLARRHVDARGGEQLARGCDEAFAVPLRVAARGNGWDRRCHGGQRSKNGTSAPFSLWRLAPCAFSALSIAARFSVVRAVVTMISGPYFAEEPFGCAVLSFAKGASTDCLLSYWRTVATSGDVLLPLQSFATKNARDDWKPGPLEEVLRDLRVVLAAHLEARILQRRVRRVVVGGAGVRSSSVPPPHAATASASARTSTVAAAALNRITRRAYALAARRSIPPFG